MRVVEFLERLDGVSVQCLPVQVEGQSEDFFVLNVIDVIDAVDLERTEGTYLGLDHPTRPGGWRMIDRLALRSEVIDGHELIYPETWRILLCASDTVVRGLRSQAISGLRYRPTGVSRDS